MADIISLILTARNDASRVIKQVQNDTKQMQKEIEKDGSSKIDPTKTMIAGALGAGAAAIAVRELGAAIADASQAAGELERLRTGMDSLATQYGTSSSDIIDSIKSVSQGTLDNKTIMQQANNAMLLGVADTADEFETLTKIAMTRGRAMGISMEYAFESIVKGVGRLSPLILDNLGIVIDADNTYAAYAATIGKTADSLTDLEKRQALLAKLKTEVADFDSSAVMDSAAAWEKFGASVHNAQAAMGGAINDVGILQNMLINLSDNLDKYSINFFGDSLDKNGQALKEAQMLIDKLSNPQDASLFDKIDFAIAKLITGSKDEAELIDEITKRIERLRGELAGIKEGIVVTGAGGGMGKFADLTESAAYQAARLNEEVGKAGEEIKLYAETMDVSKDRAEENVRNIIKLAGGYEKAIPMIMSIINNQEILNQKARDFQNIMGSAVGGLQSQILDAFANTGYDPAILEIGQARIDQLTEFGTTLDVNGNSLLETQAALRQAGDEAGSFFVAINDAAKATSGAAKSAKQMTEAYSALKDVVSSAVDTALNDFGGAKIEDYLPGAGENVDAPSRRIADVMVKGFNSPWVDYFKSTFPELFTKYMGEAGGDIQKASAMLLADYNKGMVPQLIDRDGLKKMIKDQYRADGEMAMYIDQLAQELAAEMGISLEEATAVAASGVGGAAGKKKLGEIDTQKELNAIKAAKANLGLDNWGTDFITSGKNAGIMDDTGKVVLNGEVKWSGGSGLADAIAGGGPGLGGLTMALPDTANSDIAQSVGTVKIATVPTMEQATAQASIDATPLTATVTPTVPTDITQYTNALNSAITTNMTLTPKVVFDMNAIMLDFGLVKNAIGNALVEPAYIEAIGTVFSSSLGSSLDSQSTTFGIMGVQTGIYIYQGFAEYNLGTLLAAELSRQLTEAQKAFETSANNAGKVWGGAFLDVIGKNVPFELLIILTDLVTPEVMKRVKQDKERGGGE